VTCAISWGRCSLIGLLVVMSVVVVLVLLFISFPVGGVGMGRCCCPLVLCSTRHTLDPNVITIV